MEKLFRMQFTSLIWRVIEGKPHVVKRGTVIPRCDFQSYYTETLVNTRAPPDFPSRNARSGARLRWRARDVGSGIPMQVIQTKVKNI